MLRRGRYSKVNDVDWDASMGPAMSALDSSRQRFVRAFIMQGGKNATAAARTAGFGTGSVNSIQVAASRLMHEDRVLAGLREETLKMMGGDVVEVARRVTKIALSSKQENTALKASTMIFDRVGMQAVTEHRVTVQDDRRSREELLREFVGLFREAGLNLADLAKPVKQIEPEE